MMARGWGEGHVPPKRQHQGVLCVMEPSTAPSSVTGNCTRDNMSEKHKDTPKKNQCKNQWEKPYIYSPKPPVPTPAPHVLLVVVLSPQGHRAVSGGRLWDREVHSWR